MSIKIRLIYFLVFCVVFSSVADAVIVPPYWSGAGTAENPYKVTNIAELRAIDNDGGIWCDKFFMLTNDIDFDQMAYSGAVVCPDTDVTIDDFQGVVFSGVFDGNGYAIKNLDFNRSPYEDTNDRLYYIGLFGKISQATIKNLRIENFSFRMYSYSTSNLGIIYSQVGALAGRAYGSTIDNCSVESNITFWKANAQCSYFGALCGSAKQSTITNCTSIAKITINSGVGEYIGGLIGETVDRTTIQNCISHVDMIGGYTIGGIAGSARKTLIDKCFSAGLINGLGDTGGLVGNAYMSTVKRSGAKTSVYGRLTENAAEYGTGGLVGFCDADIDPLEPVSSSYQTIENCYWQGDLLALSHAGGIAGIVDSTTSISKCYSAGSCEYPGSLNLPAPTQIPTQTSGETMASFVGDGVLANYEDDCYVDKWLCSYPGVAGMVSDPIHKKDTYDMKVANSFPDWDFVNIWFIVDNKMYPILYWQAAPYKGDMNLDGTVDLVDLATFAENWIGNM